MPELPEVEVSARGIRPYLLQGPVNAVIVRDGRLRQPVPGYLAERLVGQQITQVTRRGKYLLLKVNADDGWIIVHLGMSGSLRVVPVGTPWKKHDHVALEVCGQSVRLHDPRRFGLVVWHAGADPETHPLLAVLGPEPLAVGFNGRWLYEQTRQRRTPIKPLLMDGHFLVGVGNIYAAESLFKAGISPLRSANRISRERYDQLAAAIRMTLQTSIDAGGSTLRDYVHSDGGAGSFQIQCQVYDRAGQPCTRCGGMVRQIRQAGRSTFYCPACQR